MDNRKKLEIAKKRQDALAIQTKKENANQIERFAQQLERFVGDLNRLLSSGIDINDIDKLDSVSSKVELFGVEAVSLIERVALCIDRFSELTIPEHIELKTDSLLLDKIDQLQLEIPEDLTKKIVQLDATIVELSKALKTKQVPSKLPDDFQPVRIVVGDEGALRFLRDMPMPFFSGGGGSSDGLTDAELRASPVPVTGDLTVDTTGLATEDKQDAIISAIENIGGAGNFTTRIATDSINNNFTYIGSAEIGASPSGAVWQIKRLDATSGLIKLWADSNDSYDNVWNDREILTYG